MNSVPYTGVASVVVCYDQNNENSRDYESAPSAGTERVDSAVCGNSPLDCASGANLAATLLVL